MNDHLGKPIEPRQLEEALRRWLTPLQPPASPPGPPGPAAAPASTTWQVPGLDAAAGLRLALGRESLYRSLLTTFVHGQADWLQRFAQARQDGDAALALRMAHTLKGVAAQIGAQPLSQAAQALEGALQRGEGEAVVEPLQAAVRAGLQPLLDGLRAQRLTVAATPAMAGAPVDPAAWAALRAQLLQQLDHGDADCLALAERQAALLRQALGPAQHDAFERALRGFDFPTASGLLADASRSP